MYVSQEENRLLDSSPESPHRSESETQEVVAKCSVVTVSSRQFAPVEERRGALRGKCRGRRFTRRSHTTGQRNRKRAKQTCEFRVR